ncbi:testis-expressed protein 44 [Petaurus breviceps papuanus]|uniref:testis-expressed protein 44 n=1 Tax=Petaurus breviceps papuanus TaxID=3040969 RepID=UPI0036DBEA71
MSSFGAENENLETAVSSNNEVTGNEADQKPAQSDDESSPDYLDAREALPLSKSQDLSEDNALIPNSQLSLLFEREPDLATHPHHNPIACPEVHKPVCLTTMAPLPPIPQSSAHQLGEEDHDSDNDSYMRSITSLVGGGEGPIRSLSDILVWTETAMGTATGHLNASHTSVTDMLHGTGTALRSMTSLLSGARTVLTSSLLSGTGTVLRTVSQVLGNIERRTIEGIRFAFRFMAHHISPRRNSTDCDDS